MRAMRGFFLVALAVPALAAAQDAPPPSALSNAAAKVKAAAGKKPTGPMLGGNRDEDYEELPPPALPESALVPGEAALLRAALWAFEPAPREIRIQAIEDLGLLGDARLLNPLAHLVYDPDLSLQLAAVRAIRTIRHPRAEEILVNVVRHGTLPSALKQAALESLMFQNTRSALVFIWNVGNNPQWGATLYGTARRMLLDVPKDAWAAPGGEQQPAAPKSEAT
jgi:HEAT repeats